MKTEWPNLEGKTTDQIKDLVQESVYAVCTYYFEYLENTERIRGNGHHAAQKIADLAVKEIDERKNERT